MKLIRSIIQKPIFGLRVPRANFAVSIKDIEKNLVATLKSEISGEEVDTETQGVVESFLKEHQWKLECSENSTRMTLTKQLPNHHVKIYYEAKLPESAQEEQEEGKENQEQNSEYIDFTVVVDKKKDKKLVATIYFTDGEIYVHELFFSKNADEIAERKVTNLTGYSGPAIESLEENLQKKVNQYLGGLGVTAELAEIINQSSVLQEASLYRSYLEEFKNFAE